ncbi:MAG: cell wall hydrolase [Parvibaculales bacterium]|nr:cell wall hydrolase [Alphaproteobacteria bacterium]
MIRLLEWLDLRYIIGPHRPFLLRLGALIVIVSLSTTIIAGMRNPERIASRTVQPVAQKLDYVRGESLFRGRKPENRKESLAEAQRCMAQAIYFEARSEPIAGWEAVADVVINRALSGKYPGSICGVVFQGQYRRHKCQFSFACDGLSDRPKHRVLWRKALRMAGNKLVNVRAGPATARATHYHADYVDPYWNRSMVKLAKIGRHIFYNDHRVSDF